jgi:hypothetical protein
MQGKAIAIALTVAAGGLLLASLRLPVWQMRMEAPQYQDEEALEVTVYPNAMRGDLDEIKVLNSYIGVHIPERLPQTHWLPGVIISGAVAGVLGAFLPRRSRRKVLIAVPLCLGAALVVAAAQAQWQMHQIGTNRDEKTTLVGVKDFTTPLVGRVKVAQFTITSFLSWGSLAIAAALGLQLAVAWLSRTNQPPQAPPNDLELEPAPNLG